MGSAKNRSASAWRDEWNQGPVHGPYPPLDEVTKALRVQWYRCPMERDVFFEFMQRSDASGFAQALGHLCLWLCTGLLVYCCWMQSIHSATLLAVFAHGSVGSCFIFGCHELGHGTVFATKWLNKVFLYIFSMLWWWDPIFYAMSHTYHHRYTQFPEADRENLFPLEPSLDPWLLLQLFTVKLFGTPGRVIGKGGLVSTVKLTFKAACGGIPSEPDAPSYAWTVDLFEDQPVEAVRSMWFNRVLLLFHAAVFVASVCSGQWIFIVIVNFHSFFAMWLTYFWGQTQHIGLKSSAPDFRKNTRSITLDPISEFLYWRMNWHIEHHMFAAVPCYNLKALHHKVAHDMPVPRTLLGAWREMREIWRRQKQEPDYEFDTPLPEGAGTGKVVNQMIEAGSASIGDLAPEGLATQKHESTGSGLHAQLLAQNRHD